MRSVSTKFLNKELECSPEVRNPQRPFSGSSQWSLIALIFLEGWSPYELILVPSTWASSWALKRTVWLYSQEIKAKPFMFKGCQQRKEGKRKILHQSPKDVQNLQITKKVEVAEVLQWHCEWQPPHHPWQGDAHPVYGNKGSGRHRCCLRLASGREGRTSFSDLHGSCR